MQPTYYSVRPSSKDRLSTVLGITFALVALAAFYLSRVMSAYGSIAQAVGLLAISGAVYIVARNRMPMSYTVEREAAGELYDLVIANHKGRQHITVCRLALRDIREIDVADKQNIQAIRQKYQNDTLHNYCPTLFPEQSLFLRFADSDPYAAPTATEELQSRQGERIVIRIAYDATILAMLRAQLGEH